MADDVKTTLLKFTGDAAGAKAAAQEAAAAVGQVEAAAAKQAAASANAAQRQADATRALDSRGRSTAGTLEAFGFSADESAAFAAQQQTADALTGSNRELGKSLGEIGDKSEHAHRSMRGFAQALGLVSPEMAEVARGAHDVSEGLGLLFTPMGAGIAAAGASLLLYKGWLESIRKEADELTAANMKLAASMRDVQAEIDKQLAKRGISQPDASGKGRTLEGQLEESGFKRETAVSAAALAFDKSGKQVLSDQQVREVAALSEAKPEALGDVEKLTPQSIASKLSRPKNREVIDSYLKALDTANENEQSAIQRFDKGAIAERLKRGPGGLPEDQIKSAVEDVINVAKKGDVVSDFGNPFGYEQRQKLAVDRAQQIGLIDASQASKVRDRGFFGNQARDALDAFGIRSAQSNLPRSEVSPDAGAVPSTQPTTQPATVINNTINTYAPSYHGPSAPQTVRRLKGVSISRK